VNAATRRLRAAQAGVAGFALGLLLLASLSEAAYWKDIQVEYLTARALRDGIDVFTPLDRLAGRYFPVATDNFPHPSPHPPALAVVSLPLSFLPFRVVVPLWLAFNVWLLILVGRWLRISLPGALALAAWPPLWYLLLVGQLELVILALAMLGWRAAAAGRDWSAGLWLGLAASIKLYPVLLLVPFVARRRMRVLLAAGVVLVLSQGVGLAAVGTSGLVRYYRDVVPTVSAHYAHVGLNASPYGALLRIFGGATDVRPLLDIPVAVLPLTIAVCGFALLALARMPPEASPVAALVALPNVWYTYPVLALPQIVVLLRSRLKRPAVVAVVAVSFVLPLANLLLTRAIFVWMRWHGRVAPPVAGLLTAVQPAGLVALLILSVARERAGGESVERPRAPEPVTVQPRP